MHKIDNRPSPVLALDGPSGAGKGTVGQRCAAQLGWHYLDSGAIYRALAWAAGNAGIAPTNEIELVGLADQLQFVCHVRLHDVAEIEVNGVMATDQLRTEEKPRPCSE